jgi:hypothetical protein
MMLVSSVLRCIHYDRSTQELTVVFNDGTSYRYSAVPKRLYDCLLAAKSKGTFFNIEIRNHYQSCKIPATES